MNPTLPLAFAAALLALPAWAESHEAIEASETAEMAAPTGDAANGETVFGKRCVTCHVVVNAEGEKLAGRAARTGPNLFQVAGHAAGAAEDFRYGKDLAAAGEAGLTWTEENFVAYVQDPHGFLRSHTGDDGARSKMSFRLKSAEDAADIYAYLVSLDEM